MVIKKLKQHKTKSIRASKTMKKQNVETTGSQGLKDTRMGEDMEAGDQSETTHDTSDFRTNIEGKTSVKQTLILL